MRWSITRGQFNWRSAGRVDALDLTEAMLERARLKINKRQLDDRVHFSQGNARELPYPDASFDLLYNGYMFDLIALDGFAPLLKEFHRVLKPGGKLVLVNMSKPCIHRLMVVGNGDCYGARLLEVNH